MNFYKALSKLTCRKKINGYYESSQLLTVAEKQSILIASFLIIIPIVSALVLVVINKWDYCPVYALSIII